MARFEVLANGVLIGHSELESGDPPMGVAEGRFLPSPANTAIQPSVVTIEIVRRSIWCSLFALLTATNFPHEVAFESSIILRI